MSLALIFDARLIATLAVLAVLPACAPEPAPFPWSDYAAEATEEVHIVRFAPNSAVLSDADAERLRALAGPVGPTIAVAEVSVSAGGPLAVARQAAVLAALGQVPVGATRLQTVAPLTDRAVVTVLWVETVPLACADGPIPPDGSLPPGCANAYNLARSVEQPRDLYSGRDPGPSPAAPSARALERYLAGEVEPLLPERTTRVLVE